MASGGGEEDDGGIPLDIDNVHMLLQVEHEQIQKRTFTNWINAQLAKRCPPSFMADLFSDIRDGSQLLDLLEVMSGQPMKRQRGRGVFQHRANIETALNFLKKKSIKLVNINIPDIIDGRPSIILGLVWTIILHCHIEELASTLAYNSCHSSLDSLASLDSFPGSPIPASPVPAGRTSPLHRRFRVSAKKALLMWVRDQCKKVGCSVSVKNFKSSWRSGEAFLAILCSLRPQLADLSLVQSRSNQENLEEAFHLAERELHIPRLLEPQDVDVEDPDEKSIMTYVAQFLQYSNDMPAPDDHLQVSPSERALEVTCWLQQAFEELSEAWTATEKSNFAEKYHVFQNVAGSFTEQRRPVMTLLAAIRRCPELSQEQCALRTAWDRLEEELQRCKADLDSSLPPPLNSVVTWLQRAEAVLTEEGGRVGDHADAAKEARAQQDMQKSLMREMSHHVKILDDFLNMDDSGNEVVPPEKFDEIKRRLTNIRVTAKYQGIKLEYRECRHTVLDLLGRITAKLQTWKAPYSSQETVLLLLQDWHETVDRQSLLLILMDALQNLKEKANAYNSKAALGNDSQLVTRQVKEAESEAELATQVVTAVRGTMERVVSAWETYDKCLTALQTWLAQEIQSSTQSPAAGTKDMSEWTSCQAKLNEAGNFLIEMTEPSTSLALAEHLSKVNMQWAECMKRTVFGVSSEPSVSPMCLQMVHSLTQEASWLLRQPLEVASVPLKANRQKLQLLSKRMAEVDLSSLNPSPDSETAHMENLQQTLPQMVVEAERTCGELQQAASRLEGRLAELDHWSTDALDCYQHLKEEKHKGRSSLEPTAKALISRGMQLENQVATERQDLLDLVARVRKTSSLQHLCMSGIQDRISETVSHCQEILGMFSNLGFQQHVETAHQTQRQLEAGLLVVVRTKHVDQVGNVMLQAQDPNQASHRMLQQDARPPQSWPKNKHVNTQGEATIVKVVKPRVGIQTLPLPIREPCIQSPLAQTVKAAESEPIMQPPPFSKSNAQAPRSSQNDLLQTPPSQTRISISRIKGQPNTQSDNTPPQPPVMVRSEVHSKAQSMARSRLEKARFRLQGRIQQAIKLFGGKEISASQAKRKQVIEDGAASVDVESLQELCETLTPRQSSCLATDQLRESDEAQETQPSDTVLPSDCRGQQLRGNTPLRATGVSADTQRSNSLPQKQSVDSQQQDLSPVCVVESVLPHADTLQLRAQDVPTQSEDFPTQCRGQGSESKLKPSLRSKEQRLKVRLLNITEDNQQTQAHVQAVVRGDTVETKQEAEWTVISETAALQQEEHSSRQEAQERYRKSRSAFQSQLQRNKQHLEEFILDPVTISTLQNQRKQLQTLKQVTQTLAFEFELQYAQISRCSRLMIREDVGEVERDWERLSQQWRGQLMCLQRRMTCLENTAELMESADDQMALIKGKLDRIIREPVDISSLTLADSRMKSDLKEMDVRLRSEARKLSERGAEVKRQELEAKFPSSLCQALHNTVHHLEQLRQQLEKVQSAAQALHHFLATVREVKAEIPTLLAKQDPGRQRNLTDWEQERHCWQAAMQQRLQTAAEQSDCVDSTLKAVGMTLTMDGAAVTCQDVVTSLSQQAVDVEKEMVRAKRRERKSDDSPHEGEEQEQDHPTLSRMEEESGLEAKRSRLEEHDETNTQGEGDHKAQTWASEGDVLKAKDQRRRISSQVKKEGEEKESLLQRRVALLGTLREIRRSAEQLRLQEPTLPALQHRTRALTELESRLAAHLAELQHMQDAALQSGILDGSQTRGGEDVWKEAKKAVSERLEQCCTLTEMLKKFQSIRGELSGTLQRAESTISEQASYLGKDNLQRLHTKVQDTKAELNSLGDGIEEIRNICRQLHTHLRKIPECTIIPFEDEADALMDRWLDVSERTDSRLENLHVGLTLWDGVLELGADVESWTTNKVAVFAQSPSFETEDNIRTMQNEIAAQEEKMERFHRRAAEVQALLQSTEPPLELQVVETQMRKKIEQLKELVSEAEDVYRQMVAAKEQITARMNECFNSLQRIQDSLLTLSGLDVATVLAKLKNLLFELQTQDEQAESLLEDLQVMASIASSVSLQSLSADAIQLQDKVRNTHQLLSEVDEETERNIQAHDRLQREGEHLKQWLQRVEERAAKEEDVSLLQEEALQQRARTEALHQLVSSLRRSTLRQCAVVEESSKLLQRYHNFQTSRLHGCTEKQSSLSRESPQSWVGDLRRADDSVSMQSGVEQKLHHAQAAVSATTEKEARPEELRVTGDCLSHKMCDEDNVKLDIQDTTEEAEGQGKDLLQSGQPCHSALQPDPDLTSSYMDRKQQACRNVEELQRRTAQLPTLFPWPGTSERRQTCLVAHQLQDEAESLQLTLTSLAEQRTELAEQTDNTGDPSLAEVDTCLSSLMEEVKGVCSRLKEGVCNEEHFGQSLQDCRHKLTSLQERMSACQAQEESSAGLITDVPALEALLQEVTDIEKDLLQIVTLKDSITASLTVEAQASLSQQVSNLQSHKRALHSSIREHLALLTEDRNQRVHQVKEEISCVQTTLKDLGENLSGNCEVSPDTNQLKQQWYTLQDCDTRLTELAARVNDLKKTGELGISQEPLHAGVTLTVEAVAKDLNSITSALLQKKQECAENTANRVRQLISQLQKWSQTVRAEPSSHSQAALNEGLRLQQDLRELLSERDILLYHLGKKATKKLQKRASTALSESTPALETLSKFLVAQGSQGHCEVELDKDLPGTAVEETCRSESDAPYLASADETTAMCPPASPSAINNKENSSSDQNDNKLETKGPLERDKEDVPKQFSSAADVFKSQHLTSTPPTFNLKTYSSREEKSEPLQEDTTSTQDSKSTVYKDNTKEITSAHCVTPLVGSPGTKPDSIPLSNPESVSEHLAAQSETFKAVTDALEEHCEDIGVTPKKVYTIMLDIEAQDTQKIESVGPDAPRCSQGAELCDTTLTEVSTIPEKNSGLLNSPESDFQSLHLAADTDISKALADAPETEKYCEDISETSDKVYTIVLDIEPQDTRKNESVGPDALRCSQEAELCDTMLTEVSTIPEKKSGLLTSPESDLESLHLAAQTDTLKALPDAPEKEKYCKDVSESSDKVYTTVLDIEPQDMQKNESVGPDALRCSQAAELCDATLTVDSTILEEKSGCLNSPELDFTSLHLAAQTDTSTTLTDAPEKEKYCEDINESSDKVYTIVLDIELPDFKPQDSVGTSRPDVLSCSQGAELCDTTLAEVSAIPEKNSGLLNSPESDFQSLHLAADTDISKALADAPETEKYREDISESSDKVYTTVLDIELPDFKPQDSVGASRPDVLSCSQGAELCDAKLTEVSSIPETESGLLTTLASPESDKTGTENHSLKSYALNESQVTDSLPENPSALVSTELDEVKSTSAKLSCKEKSETPKLMYSEVLNSSNSCGTVAECQLTGAHTAETTSPDVKQEETTDFCHAAEQTMSSVFCSAEGDAITATQIPAGDNKQMNVADTAQSKGKGQQEVADGEKPEEASDPEHPESKLLKGPKRREKATPLFEESEWKVAASLEDTEVTQKQSQESMEPERTAPGLEADLQAWEATGGSTGSYKQESTMQDVLSEIQSLVERSNIINRTPHIDLNWYLKSSPGEPEIRLVRTVQKVLACRYQPARLDVTAMANQLQEAEDYRRCVQEQVATIKSMSGARICDPVALRRVEGQCCAALLDASATVQVKATQLDQVKQYHRQMKITRAFMEVVATEKDKMSLNTLGSSALQADKLHALLQTMVQKKDMIDGLLQLGSQLSVHLSNAESSGALLAQLGDVQEEWRLLEGSIKRALQHASSSTSQSSLLIKEAELLKAKLEALQKSDFQSHDGKSALEYVCLTTDLKLYNQLYLHLQSQSDALVHFSLGQKEKDEIRCNLKELGSLLNVTKGKFDTSTGSISSAKINKQLQDLIIWAKQAENHISIGKKLALFPEEARFQITEMKKFQNDIWFRRSKMQEEVEHMKDAVSDMEKEESDHVLKTVEDLYEAIADSLEHVLDTMKKNLQEREKLLCQLASMDAWLAETHAERDPCTHVDNVSKANIRKLESELKSHKSATVEIESQLKQVEAMGEICKEIAVGLSPGESRYLVNRLSGLWTEIDGLLAHEKAASWELEELIHERTTSDEELATIQASLKQISTDVEQQRFPLTQETLSTIAHLKHMLMEHQCQAQELEHCQEAKRSSLLSTIGELQDQCKALSINATEQDKYLHLRRQMEESRDITKEQIQRAKDKTISVVERFRLCQTLLVELPLLKTQCQEAADQLEAVAQELYPSELNAERQRIHRTVETLVSWEFSVTDDIKKLEAKLLRGLQFSSELPSLKELFLTTRAELAEAEPVNPDERAIDAALRRNWVIWRNMESGMRVLEGLARKEKVNLKNYKDLYSLRDATMQECHLRMESLCQARESLKDYQWAAQGAIGFLHNAEATFLSATGGFLDCTEEKRQTEQALEALEDGFQAHISHLADLVPQQPCLSRPKQLHISILSQLLVGRAVLEAQAQLRLESLQRCEISGPSHRKCHEDIRQRLSGLEAKLSDCAAVQVTSYDKCVAQQKRAKLLMEDLRSLAGKIEELRAGCPMQGCGVGKGGELGAFWRRWVSLRRGVGLLMAHTEQRGEEWKDITRSMEQCCSLLASLQAEVPDSSTVSFTQEEPMELLAQAEIHQAGLEQEQQALASLEHRLEHALSLSSSQEPISPGPVGKTLVKIQENVRSLKERNLLVVAAAQAEEKERQQVQEEIEELERHMFDLLPALEACSNPIKQQELRNDLFSQKAKLKLIVDGVKSRYTEIPADISRRLQEVELSLQTEEEKLMEKSDPVRKLARQVAELGSGLEKVTELLEQKSATVSDAQNALKHAWDELDAWHSRLMLLESEVQDLAEEHPDQAHQLMDQLTHPLQLYQNAAQMTEQRTAFLSKIPECLQEFQDILYGATCWLDEAQSWLSAPCCFTTARGLQNHATSLQLVLDDSERIRQALEDFRPVLDEISDVCDISTHKERVDQNDQQVEKMQRQILEPLEQLLQAVSVVEAMEAELKTMEKNVPKIRAILSSVDDSNISVSEHLHNRQVILANVQSMRRTLEEVERCKGELHLPKGADESLLVFSRARLLLQPLEELEQLTQQQATLLENKIREEEQTRKDLGITALSDIPEEAQQHDRSALRHLVQEAIEVTISEEEEDEENESCHSSSSDTLTCSIPEDLEETLNDVQSEDLTEIKPLSDVKALETLTGQFSSEEETSSKSADTGLLFAVPGLHSKEFASENVETGLITMDSKAGKALSPKTETTKSLLAVAVPAAEFKFTAAAIQDTHGSPQHETRVADPHAKSPQAAAAVEDTRVIPTRPITPFSATRGSREFIEEGSKHLPLSIPSHQDLDTLNVLKEQSEVTTSQSRLFEESQQAQESSEVPKSSAGYEEDEQERLRWSRLYTQISQKLTTLKKVKEEHQIGSGDGGSHDEDPQRELASTGSASAVLQRTHESITKLKQIVSSPGENKELYEAARKVLLCLDALTDLVLTSGEDDPQLRLLQQECVLTELVTLAELLSKVESETKPALSGEKPQALRCLSSLQECLQTVHPVLTSSHSQLSEHLGNTHQHQELSSSQLCILDEFEPEHSEIFPSIKDAPRLEQCVLGRHLRESPGEKAKLQQASWSLLQGITGLLELGEECLTKGQKSQVHNRSQLQAVLCRREKLLRVLRSQLAFVQHLFQREPEALKCQEDERVQLEVRAKALQQRALEQEVASQRSIQEWTQWEDNCGGLGRLLDDVEAFISSGEPEGDDEKLAQHRQDACQQTLVQLDESRAALGLLLDQGKVLQTEPEFAATVSQAGGALELRWQSAYRRAKQESKRCRDIQDRRTRFQADFASVSKWLVNANKHQKTWSGLTETSDLSQECIHSNLIELLDFSIETEAMSVQKAAASREAAQLLHLREADCPGLRAQLAQLDVKWTQLTSDLSKTQDRLQQRLLAVWPPGKLLSNLEGWLKTLEARLSQEKETVLKAKDAAKITEVLQHYQELKAGVVNGQLLLDFLCQSGPQVVGADIQALHSERTMFAEELGALRLQWLHLQRELESQTREAEQMHHTCADREKRLQHLHDWIEQQKEQLDQCKQPTSQTLARKALQEWEAVVGRVKEVDAALQELKATRVHVGHPCDISFSGQAESVCHACGDLSQQMDALRPALQQTLEQWSCFERDLKEVSLHTTRVRCALQHQPLFSLKQAEGHLDLLQQLQEKAGKGEELLVYVDKSYQSLVKTLHPGTVQTLEDQMRGERKRWTDLVQELKDEHTKTGETLSLWQEYARLSDQCSLHLHTLWHRWEELPRSSPQQDAQAVLHSVEKLQDAAEDLQSSVGDVLAASKPLVGRLEPAAANIVQSETRMLSRDVLLLSQAVSRKKKSVQEDVEQQKLFHTRLEALEKQTQDTQQKLKANLSDTDSVKQVLLELSEMFPSLVDVRETSAYVAINNREAERLHMLSRQWVQSMMRASDTNRALEAERQRSQNFQEKCKNLMSIQKKLEEELMSKKPQSLSSLQEMLSVHQRLEADIITGHQLLQGLLCQAVESMETAMGEKRSELMAQVISMRESWFNSVTLASQRRSLTKEQLGQWRVYHRGSKLLWKLLRDVDPLLSPAGPALCALQQLRSCLDDNQCVEDALGQHTAVYTQTLEAGRHLCETMTESECQSRLQSELQAIQEAWERSAPLLERRRDLVMTTVQKWSQCQDGITRITSELDEMKNKLEQPLPERLQDSESKTHIQETDLSLQRVASGFKELATMKTDLSQYVAAGDSALLEQQLEQLHTQWEELCMKVSLRRQEIADRLNAWTIFNDKNKEFCDWLTQMENKVCHSGDLSIEEMVEKLKKDCMEEINLFSENKSHLKQLGEQLLLASDEAKQTQVHGSLQEVNQRWHNLFHDIEARVKKLKETLVAVQQLDKNMSNLRSWLSRIEAELSRPITYSVCHHQEIQRRLAEQQELQRDIEQHTEGVASVLSLCDVLLRDEDAAGGTEAESDSLQETSRSLDQRWRAICAMALDRRLRIEETWRLWCKFLDDYSQFEDWLKMAERTAANPNSTDVLYTVAKEELKKFEGFQRQVHERLTQLELVNNQYRRLARENRTDRASQLKAMVHEGNRRWDTLHRRVAAILRRLKYFTSQREEFEGTRESMLVWLTELDLQLTNVEHFSESDVHHKIQQLNSFQKEITLNTERIDGLIVFGEGLIQKSSPQDAALIEDELEELHSYCQEVFGRLVRFHQRLSQPSAIKEEPELSATALSLESSLELIGRPWLGRTHGSLPATPIHLLASPLEGSGRETPVSVDSLPLEWDHTGDVGGSSSHEDDEEEEDKHEDDRTYFSALSVSSRSLAVHDSPRWQSQGDPETQSLQLDSEGHTQAPPTLTSTPLKQGYLRLMSQCSGSIEDIKRVSLILDDEEQPEELGLTGLTASDQQSGVIERWELLQAQSRSNQHAGPQEPRQLTSDLDEITSWLGNTIPELERLQQSDPAASIEDMAARAVAVKEMQKKFTHYKSIMLSANLRAQEAPELQERLAGMNRDWSRACTGLQQWDTSLRKTLMRCQEFHETLHSLLLWLAHGESRLYAVDISDPDTPVQALRQHYSTLTDLQEELQGRQTQQASLQALWSQLQPEDEAEESIEAQEKLHVTGGKLKSLLRRVDQDLGTLQQRLDCESASEAQGQSASAEPKNSSSSQRQRRDSSPPRSFFYRVLRAAFPLQLLLLFLLLLPCLIPLSDSEPGCAATNNYAWSFYPTLHYTNGPPPT